jgi:hypothetical protein
MHSTFKQTHGVTNGRETELHKRLMLLSYQVQHTEYDNGHNYRVRFIEQTIVLF